MANKSPSITATVRKLRLALGDTQQQFAARMGWAISTAVRYESTRAPKGRALADLARLANQNGYTAHSQVFARQVERELGVDRLSDIFANGAAK